MKKLGIALIVLSFYFFLPSVFLITDTTARWLFPYEYNDPSDTVWHFIKINTSSEIPLLFRIASSAIGVLFLITGIYLLRQSKQKKSMTQKQLQAVSVMMLGVGLSGVAPFLYDALSDKLFLDEYESITLEQKELSGNWESPELDDYEPAAIFLIGTAISLSWYSPFFVVSYWLYKKSKHESPG